MVVRSPGVYNDNTHRHTHTYRRDDKENSSLLAIPNGTAAKNEGDKKR